MSVKMSFVLLALIGSPLQANDYVKSSSLSAALLDQDETSLTVNIDQNNVAVSRVADGQPAKNLVLPQPSRSPLEIDFGEDPILLYTSRRTQASDFNEMVKAATIQYPALSESRAGQVEADAAYEEVRSELFPTVDLTLGSRNSLARNFANDDNNILERSRARSRVDATFNVQQRLFDFGAAPRRVLAAGARIEAARFELERQADEIALDAITVWYDVFGYRALTEISANMVTRYAELGNAIKERIAMGASAEGDQARVDGYIASHNARHSAFQRQLDIAGANFLELFTIPPPLNLARVVANSKIFPDKEMVREAARNNPIVKAANAQARSAELDAKAARADTLPRITAGLEGGRFGVFDSGNDYDVRGTLTLSHRFFGGNDARADGAKARAAAALARAARISSEAGMQASIALTNLEALDRQVIATEQNYIAQRKSRDVIFERFRLTRGTLFDVFESDRALFDAAVSHIQTVSERDAAHYVLLSRMGKLLGELGIEEPQLMGTE